MSIDRLIHLAVGIAFFAIFLKLSNTRVSPQVLFLGFISMALGTWVSDWDLFFGIAYHRSPLTHSFLPAVLVVWLVLRAKMNTMLIIGFCLGLSSHLFWDIIAYGNVQWISGGNNDRLFLFANSIILLAVSKYFKSSRQNR